MEPIRTLSARTLLLMLSVCALVVSGCATSGARSAQPAPASATPQAAPPPPVPQLFGGGTQLFPGRRMVALYGHPNTPAMGVLGEQGIPQSIDRARKLAASYQPLVKEPVVPAFELIATVADAGPGDDGDYSAESTPADLKPWIDAAEKAGVYVVLDLQSGRADFLSQAKRYEALLSRPNVGLALDPEWRLQPGQRPGGQIGSVGAAEVNRTSAWLADLTKRKNLPQKVFMLHQFRVAMLPDRQKIDTSRAELATVLHADGFGDPGTKMGTWNTLHASPMPPKLSWGWKNFYDEDTPMFTPAQTLAVRPAPPVFVSFQ